MTTKIAVVTCQPDPDYVRARVLRAAIDALPNRELLVVKNTQRGVFRYPEVAFKLLRARFTENPDVYLLTFRGYEMLPWLLVVAMGKRVIFDEFINAVEWAGYEHKKYNPESFIGKLFGRLYGFLLRQCDMILTDTESHADLSAQLSSVPRSKYEVLPVGTDETVFHPEVHPTKLDLRKTSAQPESALDKPEASLSDGEVAIATSTAEKSVMNDQNGSDEAGILCKSSNKSEFSVFFYGNVLPLHGLEVMLDAALRLKDYTDISFIFVGGKQKHRELVETAIANGARITYKTRVPFVELPTYVHNASLCLGGPFGDTYQSQHVITGKTYQFLAAAAPTVVGSSNASSVFTDKKDCLLVPQGNATALADVILWSKEHSKQLISIGDAGRELYEKAFSNEVIAQRLANLV